MQVRQQVSYFLQLCGKLNAALGFHAVKLDNVAGRRAVDQHNGSFAEHGMPHPVAGGKENSMVITERICEQISLAGQLLNH